ncbi:hypothetical protein SpCBS45565_g02232 [Spizellomyces sp. 'palustris']|nr:hypothetical protein SpCBS45565_g02232 [Spizellomyces sp. 'palustris']
MKKNQDALRLKRAIEAFSYMDWDKTDELFQEYKDIFYAHDEQCQRAVENVIVLTQSELADVLPGIELTQRESGKVKDTLKALFSITEVSDAVDTQKTKEPRYRVHVARLLTSIALLSPNAENVDEEEKAKLAFDMIDLDGTGYVVRDELRATIHHSALDNALQLSDTELDAVADALMQHMDMKGNGRVTFDEFKHSINTRDATLNPLQADKKAADFLLRSKSILLDEDDEEDDRWTVWRRIRIYISLHAREIACLVLYAAVDAALFVAYFMSVYEEPAKKEALGLGAASAKGFAGILYFNVPLCFLSMSRTLLTYARGTWLESLIPFDHAILFHQIVGYVIVMAAIGHIGCHLSSTYVKVANLDDLNALNSVVSGKAFPTLPTYSELIIETLPGISGLIATLALLILVAFSIPQIRRQHFNTFWYSHHAFLVFSVALLIHGIWKWIQFPHMFMYLSIPLLWYFIERLLRIYRATYLKYDATEIKPEAEKTVKLKLTPRKSHRRYRPGQYVFINIPSISSIQWHPYTLTSSPLEDSLVVHIRDNGDWSGAVAKLAKTNPEALKKINVDGPFGAPAEHFEDFENVMLIGTGIGVTPFASILRDLQIRIQTGDRQPTRLRRIDLFWINRSRGAFSWFTHLLKELERNTATNFFRVHTFITSANSSRDIRSVLLWKGLQLLRHESSASILTGLTREAYWGRPDWNVIFDQTAASFSGGTVGVFFCGPEILAEELWDLSKKKSATTNCRFIFRKENF